MNVKTISKFFVLSFLVLGCKHEKKAPDGVKEEVLGINSKMFELVDSSTTNIIFNNHIEEDLDHFFGFFNYVYNGAGVAIGDINNDGLSDIYFVGNEVENKLYLNKGDFKFKDITKKANVGAAKGWHNGVVMADVNGDGFLDIYVCRGGYKDKSNERSNLLYINQGDLTFKEQAEKYGLNDEGYSLMASFFDADNDNDLDMYLTNRPNKFFIDYKQVLKGKEKEEDLFRDKLYINENGNYEEIGIKAGIKNNYGYGLGLATTDLNNDGKVDIYVSNDYLERDYAYINKGDNSFKDELIQRFNHIPFYAMGVDVVDFNNDGFEDMMQLEMLPEDYERSKTTMASMNTKLFSDMTSNGFHYQYMHNVLHLNRGKGIFSDISAYSGVEKTDWSWSCLGSDFDNDGYRDLFITNGFKRDIWDKDTNSNITKYMQSSVARKKTDEENAVYIINQFKENKIANYIYKNNKDLTFSKKIKEWGLEEKSFSNGAAVADLDNDGDLDLIVNNIEDKAFIYENKAEKLNNNYLKIKLVGPAQNRSGLGAKITIEHNHKKQFHEFKTVRGYLSSVEPIIHFGLEKDTIVNKLKVVWKDGKTSTIKNVISNQLIQVNYVDAVQEKAIDYNAKNIFKNKTIAKFSKPFVHKENVYNDFKEQVLLPHKLSQNGPCIAVGDINGDTLEDFFIGGAANQQSTIYTQNSSGNFIIKENVAIAKDANFEDVGAVFFDADNDNDLDLYVVSGGNEFKEQSVNYSDRLYLNNGKGDFTKSNNIPQILESGSCVISLDFDNDNDLDLFIGGRLTPNKYPLAPKSFLLENTNGIFKDVTNKIAPELSKIGMVTSAVFNDIDNDGSNELIVVGEWMPITVFKKKQGVYNNITADLNLLDTAGWWNKIVAADIDKDGDIDFVVGNLGLNYKFKASKEKPFMVFASDYDSNGTNDIFLAKYYNDRKVPIRGKECTSEQLPSIGEKFKTYTEFAKADINEIIGDNKKAITYEVKQFASIVLENTKGDFKIKKLPSQAQFSVVNGIVINDFNADGFIDIALAGNKFEVEIETTRADASIGLVLLGSKTGDFIPMSYLESGLYLPGNVKDMQGIVLKNEKKAILSGINDGQLEIFVAK